MSSHCQVLCCECWICWVDGVVGYVGLKDLDILGVENGMSDCVAC